MENDWFTAAIRTFCIGLGPMVLVGCFTRRRFSFKLPLLLLCMVSFAAGLPVLSIRYPQDIAWAWALALGAMPAVVGWLYWRWTRDFWEKFDAEQAWPSSRKSG